MDMCSCRLVRMYHFVSFSVAATRTAAALPSPHTCPPCPRRSRQAYQYKIQQKQAYIEQLSEILNKLNVTVPKGTAIDETAGDFAWDDDVSAAAGCCV